MRTLSATILASLCVASASAAQKTTWFPSDHAKVEGYSYDSTYHFAAGIGRTQYFFDKSELGIPDKAKVSRFGFRQDGSRALSGHKLQLEVWMGKSARNTKTLSGTFGDNYFGAATTVVAKKIVSLPTFPKPPKPGEGKVVWITLDKPYLHDASQSLILDLRVWANDHGNKAFTYSLDKARYVSPNDSFGAGCKTSSGSTPKLTTGDAYLGGYWRYYVSQGPASALNVALIGTRRATAIDLTGLGANGCGLWVDPLLVVPGGVTSSGGSLTVQTPIPNVASLYAVKFSLQCMQSDVFANNFGWAFGNAIELQIGRNPKMGHVFKGGQADAVKGGAVRSSWPLVTVFEHN